jgi:hypothetical protein
VPYRKWSHHRGGNPRRTVAFASALALLTLLFAGWFFCFEITHPVADMFHAASHQTPANADAPGPNEQVSGDPFSSHSPVLNTLGHLAFLAEVQLVHFNRSRSAPLELVLETPSPVPIS